MHPGTHTGHTGSIRGLLPPPVCDLIASFNAPVRSVRTHARTHAHARTVGPTDRPTDRPTDGETVASSPHAAINAARGRPSSRLARKPSRSTAIAIRPWYECRRCRATGSASPRLCARMADAGILGDGGRRQRAAEEQRCGGQGTRASQHHHLTCCNIMRHVAMSYNFCNNEQQQKCSAAARDTPKRSGSTYCSLS